MKILLITGSYPPMLCGVGDYTAQLVSSLRQHTDIGVSVLTSVLDAADAASGRPEVRYVMPNWSVRGLWCFLSQMRQIKPDIVHIQFPTQGYVLAVGAVAWIPLLCRLMFRVPVVETWHEFVPRSEPNILRCMCAMALGASALVVVRPDYLSRTPRLIRIALGRIPVRIIPNVSNVPTVILRPDERLAIRSKLGVGESRLIAHFGFVYPHKGTEQLFEIADPEKHRLLFIGELSERDPYHAQLLACANSPKWKGRVTVTGFVPAADAARLLAASDAVVFPFIGGGGNWNTSVHAATSQGSFVLMTSTERNGYDAAANIYYARPSAVDEMRKALAEYSGVRNARPVTAEETWSAMAAAHQELYRSLLNKT